MAEVSTYYACMFGMHRLVTRPYSSLVKALSCLHNYAVQHAMSLMQVSVGRTTDIAQFRGWACQLRDGVVKYYAYHR